jgi:hypothetical protein
MMASLDDRRSLTQATHLHTFVVLITIPIHTMYVYMSQYHVTNGYVPSRNTLELYVFLLFHHTFDSCEVASMCP